MDATQLTLMADEVKALLNTSSLEESERQAWLGLLPDMLESELEQLRQNLLQTQTVSQLKVLLQQAQEKYETSLKEAHSQRKQHELTRINELQLRLKQLGDLKRS